MKTRSLLAALACGALLAAGCVQGGAPEDDAGSRLEIQVAPLQLTDIIDAQYTITVTNGAQTVWSETITSSQYGDNAGAASYVGPCDASAAQNRVTLTLDWIQDSNNQTIQGTGFPNPTPVWIDADCDENEDTSVVFNLVIARPANQGFFDIAVNFSDIFCSAKLDCLDDRDQPLKLLHNGAGVRETTVVLGLACTSGNGEDTFLHASSMLLDCGSKGVYPLHPTGGPGNTGGVWPFVYEHAIYQGREAFTDFDKCYWNQAIGLDMPIAAYAGASCTLRGKATASPRSWPTGLSPDDTVWPYVEWQVDVLTNGQLACGRHALDHDTNENDGSWVSTDYTSLAGAEPFPFEMECVANPDVVVTGVLCDPRDDAVFSMSDGGMIVAIDGAVGGPFALPGDAAVVDGCCAGSPATQTSATPTQQPQ